MGYYLFLLKIVIFVIDFNKLNFEDLKIKNITLLSDFFILTLICSNIVKEIIVNNFNTYFNDSYN